MFASIKSEGPPEFYCRIQAESVYTSKNILVYELVDSSFSNDIVKKVNENIVGKFRYIALDTQGQGYLFDFQNKKKAGDLGKCRYKAD